LPVTRRGAVLFAALCVVWGIPYLLIKVAVAEISPVSLVLLRTGIAAVLLLPIALARGQVLPVLARWRPSTPWWRSRRRGTCCPTPSGT
jgi:drug/metabolite transporter (DMT)-like permease